MFNSALAILSSRSHAMQKKKTFSEIQFRDVPLFIPPILNLDELDNRILVGSEESFFWTKQLLFQCGVFAGVSCGAVVAAARKIAEKMEKGKIVLLIADSGDKYVSSGLWTKDYNEIEKNIENKIWW